MIPLVCIFIMMCIFECSSLAEQTGTKKWPKFFERHGRPLRVDGSWSTWNSWSSCYKNTPDLDSFFLPLYSFLVQSRNRTCTDPKPLHGGENCKPPSRRYRQCSCMNPLGMSTKLIKDSQISAFNYFSGYEPHQARLGKNYTGWCAKRKPTHFTKPYIQIEFEQFANVGALSIANNEVGQITSYKAQYSLNGNRWHTIMPDSRAASRKKDVFKGNLLKGKLRQSNFSRHKIMKYLRIIPTKSYGKPCLKMEAYGCMYTCGKLLTGSYGQLIARSKVEIDQNCLWRVEVLNTTSLSFNFNVFDVMCENGYLDFYDGKQDFRDSTLIKRVCLKHEDDEVPQFKVNKNAIWVTFVSNSSSAEVGFNIRYSSECKQIINLVQGEPFDVESPNYPGNYFNNLDCLWDISPPFGENRINITIKKFNVESSIAVCSDSLTIHCVTDNGENVFGSFCSYKNKQPPKHILLECKKVLIVFKTDQIVSKEGFKLTVVSGSKATPTKITPHISYGGPHTTIGGGNPFSPVGGDNSISTVDGDNSDSTGNQTNIDGTKITASDDEVDWTIIIIVILSAIVLTLVLVVIGTNIRRFIVNRNELNAHCAKVAAAKKEELKKSGRNTYERNSLLHNSINYPVLAKHSPEKNIDNHNNDDIIHDSVDEESSLFLPKTSVTLNSEESSKSPLGDEIDNPSDESYTETVLQVHSPLKTSCQDVNVEDSTESCV